MIIFIYALILACFTYLCLLILILLFRPKIKHTEFTHIIILGAHVNNDEPSEILKSRLDTCLKLSRLIKFKDIIVTGTNTHHSNLSEAKVMAKYLTDSGINKPIICEDQAKTTQENFLNSMKYINNENVLVVTNQFHLLRASVYCRMYHINASYYGAPNYPYIRSVIREPIAIIVNIKRYLVKKLSR